MSLAFREEMDKLSGTIGADAKQNSKADVEEELVSIFGESGAKVLLIEFSEAYSVVAADAVRRPGAFHTALYYLLGDLGAKFVMDRINIRMWGKNPQGDPLISDITSDQDETLATLASKFT